MTAVTADRPIDPGACAASVMRALHGAPAADMGGADRRPRPARVPASPPQSHISAHRQHGAPRPAGPSTSHHRGLEAEARVAAWVTARGWTVQARRWRCAAGEIDLIARTPDRVMVAVEVKARHSDSAAQAAVTARSRQRIAAAAAGYMADHPATAGSDWRFDVVTIAANGQLNHHPHAWLADAA